MRAMIESAAHSPASLSVSIVLYHSDLTLLSTLLDSLARAIDAARAAGDLDGVSVTLVDNSCDGDYHRQLQTVAATAAMTSDVRVLGNVSNPGFGASHNRALKAAISDYHLVLNPDVVLDQGALSAGIRGLNADSQVQLVSPYVESPEGQQEFLCKRYPSVWVLLLRAFAPAALKRPFDESLATYEYRDLCTQDQAVDVELASGCFMLVRTEALRTVGGFDEAFFLYFEDFDLSLRLARLGRLVYLPTMRIVHHGGYAASKGLRHIRLFVVGGVRFFNRHGWRWI